MDITIIDSAAAENLVSNYSIQWELTFAKAKKKMRMSYFVYGGLIILGLYDIFKSKDDTDVLLNIPIGPIFITTGVIMLYVTIYQHMQFSKYNKANLKFLDGNAQLFQKGNNERNMRLTDEAVHSNQYENSAQVSWDYFNYYSIHNDLIILHQNTKIIQNYVIRRDQVQESEYEEILTFLEGKLTRFYYS